MYGSPKSTAYLLVRIICNLILIDRSSNVQYDTPSPFVCLIKSRFPEIRLNSLGSMKKSSHSTGWVISFTTVPWYRPGILLSSPAWRVGYMQSLTFTVIRRFFFWLLIRNMPHQYINTSVFKIVIIDQWELYPRVVAELPFWYWIDFP